MAAFFKEILPKGFTHDVSFLTGTLAKANPITAPEEPLASLQDKRAMPTPVSLQNSPSPPAKPKEPLAPPKERLAPPKERLAPPKEPLAPPQEGKGTPPPPLSLQNPPCLTEDPFALIQEGTDECSSSPPNSPVSVSDGQATPPELPEPSHFCFSSTPQTSSGLHPSDSELETSVIFPSIRDEFPDSDSGKLASLFQ